MDDLCRFVRPSRRYRALAANVTDEPIRAGLLELAEKYEALARGTPADDAPPNAR
jgi:hypothetical protein